MGRSRFASLIIAGEAARCDIRKGTNHRVTEDTETRHTEKTGQGQRHEAYGTSVTVLSWPVFLSVLLPSVSSVTLWFVPFFF
jgi:hypothetical protein